ncbi:hypothetical protein AKO1_012224 [Acrasis kona]|uniref:Tubby C-terminal domain-containing protein n=1 Tax=Acrasis kona TaxID=1008807 RepID=A0AAW2Z9S9_9EUKA
MKTEPRLQNIAKMMSPGARICPSQNGVFAILLEQKDILGLIWSYTALDKESRTNLKLVSSRFFIDYVIPFAHDHNLYIKHPPQDVKKTVKCYIIRDSKRKRYMMYEDGTDKFLMSAQKHSRFMKGCHYAISLIEDDVDGEHVIGYLSSNFAGTKMEIIRLDSKGALIQAGAIHFKTLLYFSSGPRRLQIAIPEPCKNQQIEYSKESTMSNTLLSDQHEGLVVAQNKKPRYCPNSRTYSLTFNGRVTRPSVKNFQISHPESPNRVIIQFGRVGNHKFNMDYSHPYSAFQAFCIALSSFDFKLGCN